MNNENIKKEELDKSFFVSFCIEQYKKHLNVSGNYIIDLFDQYGVVNYLYDNYDVLHTQGSQWLIEDIELFSIHRSKGDTIMNRIITNDNLHLLLPGKITLFAQRYAEEHHVSLLEALRVFYHSNTYKNLEKEETKIWHYGPVALYEEFKENR